MAVERDDVIRLDVKMLTCMDRVIYDFGCGAVYVWPGVMYLQCSLQRTSRTLHVNVGSILPVV